MSIDEKIGHWKSYKGQGMTSALGEYVPSEFWELLDAFESSQKQITTLTKERDALQLQVPPDDLVWLTREEAKKMETERDAQAKHREREHNLILEMKDEISKLKSTYNDLKQKMDRFKAVKDWDLDAWLDWDDERKALTQENNNYRMAAEAEANEVDRLNRKNERLREALIILRDCDWVITLPDRMDAVREIARQAIQEIDNE